MIQNSPFEKRVRVRACGLLYQNNKLLLLKHKGLGPKGYLWSPPGGGVTFGESLKDALKREFKEETALDIKVGDFLFANEHIDEKHHAIELFFQVTYLSGSLKVGIDPELSEEDQMLTEAKFLTLDHIKNLAPETVHSMFHCANKIDDLSGLITFNDD